MAELDLEQGVDKAKEYLTRKLGPLPAWAWGVIGAGAIIVWRMVRNQSGSPARSPSASLSTSAGEGALFATTSGGGLAASPAPAFDAGFGAPEFQISTPGGTFISGPESILDRILPIVTPTSPIPGSGTGRVGGGANQPIGVVVKSYLPLNASNIRALFRDFPQCFKGNPEYWVNGFQGTGTPGVTAARQSEWPDFWRAYNCAGLRR